MKCLKNHLHCVVTIVWKDELVLIKETPVFDEVGNQVMQETLTTVFCEVKSVSRSEFYNASSVGLKPTLVFKVHLFEYENEELAFRAAAMLMIILPVCFRDRYNAVGCIGGMNTGELKLYLNGALEIIIDEQL